MLDSELVTVVRRDDSRGVFEIRVGELETIVTIELCRYMFTNDTEFELSHAIKTPLQIGPYTAQVVLLAVTLRMRSI